MNKKILEDIIFRGIRPRDKINALEEIGKNSKTTWFEKLIAFIVSISAILAAIYSIMTYYK